MDHSLPATVPTSPLTSVSSAKVDQEGRAPSSIELTYSTMVGPRRLVAAHQTDTLTVLVFFSIADYINYQRMEDNLAIVRRR